MKLFVISVIASTVLTISSTAQSTERPTATDRTHAIHIMADKNHDGVLDRSEFIALISHYDDPVRQGFTVEQAFAMADMDEDNGVTANELQLYFELFMTP